MRFLTAATIIAGISGFVVIIVAAWALGADIETTTEFNAYWGLFFAATGVLGGIMQETTRAVAAARENAGESAGSARPSRPARPLVVALGIGTIIALIVAASGPLWIGQLMRTEHITGVVLLAIGLFSYAIQAAVAGVLSGCQLWRQYATMISLDSGIRMVIALVAWQAGWGLFAFLVITVIGAASWLAIAATSPQARAALRSLTDVPPRTFITRTGTAMVASGANAVLITGFPTLVRLTNPDTTGQAVTAAAVIYAVTLTRAPLLVPLQQFQSAMIVHFVKHRTAPLHALARPLGLVWAVGLFGAAAAWLLGPWLMEFLLRQSAFAVPGHILALLTVGATCTASLMVAGSATVAYERHGLYLAGWLVATGVAVGMLLLPTALAWSAALALIVGPLIGLALQCAGMLVARPAR